MNHYPKEQMKRFRVVGDSIDMVSIDLWAINEEQALQLAEDIPLGLFHVAPDGESFDLAIELDEYEEFEPVNNLDDPVSLQGQWR